MNVAVQIRAYGLLYVDSNGGGAGSSFYALTYGDHEKISGTGAGINITDNGDNHTVTLTGNNGGYLYIPIY